MSWNDNEKKNNNAENKKPFAVNRDEGVAAWLNTDKNGNTYVSVKLPLGLGYVNLFANNDPDSDDYRHGEALNKLREHLENN